MLHRKPQMFLRSNGGASGVSRQKGGGGSVVKNEKTFSAENPSGRLDEDKRANEINRLILNSPVGTQITRTYMENGFEKTEQGRISVNVVNGKSYKILIYKRADGTIERRPVNAYNIFETMIQWSRKISIGQTALTKEEKAAPKLETVKKPSTRTTRKVDNTPNVPTTINITERKRWENPDWKGRGDKENPRYIVIDTKHKLDVYPRIPEGTATIDFYSAHYRDFKTGQLYFLARAKEQAGEMHGSPLGYVTEKTAKKWEREYVKENGGHSLQYTFAYISPMGISER